MSTRSTHSVWFALIALVFFCGVLFWMTVGPYALLWYQSRAPNYSPVLRYTAAVTNSLNPYALQKWALGSLTSHSSQFTNGSCGPVTPPHFVRNVPAQGGASARIYLKESNARNGQEAHADIIYLGGFVTWGIAVGGPQFQLTEEPRCWRWVPGVYIKLYH